MEFWYQKWSSLEYWSQHLFNLKRYETIIKILEGSLCKAEQLYMRSLRRQPYQEKSSVVQHWRRKIAGIKHRCTEAARQAVRNSASHESLPCPKWFMGGRPIAIVLHLESTQVHLKKSTTCSASPFLRCPAVPQRQKTGRNVEDLDTANTVSQQNMEQRETVSTLSFPKRIMSAGPGWRLHQS